MESFAMPGSGSGGAVEKPSVQIVYRDPRTARDHPDLKNRLLNTRALSSAIDARANHRPIAIN